MVQLQLWQMSLPWCEPVLAPPELAVLKWFAAAVLACLAGFTALALLAAALALVTTPDSFVAALVPPCIMRELLLRP